MSALRTRRAVLTLAALAIFAGTSCGRTQESSRSDSSGPAANLLLITIDTLRADAVGAYGEGPAARTPGLDALAAQGMRFERAFAPAPITLPSHASMLTGLYPPGHGARHNGMALRAGVPTLATVCREAGFATAAFVSAFPLDRRFGLARGFDEYGDRLPRGAAGPANERAGSATVDEAIAWLERIGGAGLKPGPSTRFFLWVHLFEPHAPYGNPRDGRPARERYADEATESDRQVARLLDALGPARAQTLVIATADHGEAFGEHGEIGHSIFVYDTTLRVPLLIAGPGIAVTVVSDPVSLVDVPPTALAHLGLPPLDADGVDVSANRPPRLLYAESFAPLLDFGWSALRSARKDGWKYIAAPRPELFDLTRDPGERTDRTAEERSRASELEAAVSRIAGPELPRDAGVALDSEARRRLGALGYVGPAGPAPSTRPDPKDRRALAARIARVTSGELAGDALRRELEAIVAEDASNPQAHLRLAFALAQSGDCVAAEPHFARAIALDVPSADPYLGLAGCQAKRRDPHAAIRTLETSLKVEAGNPVVLANLGILRSEVGDHRRAIEVLSRAVDLDASFDEARFNLAIAYARAGRRAEAVREARALLDRLPLHSSQRLEVERLLNALK